MRVCGPMGYRCCKQAEMEKRAAGAKVAKDIAEYTQAAAAAQRVADGAAEKLEVEKRQMAERQRQLERKQVRMSRICTRARARAHTHTHTPAHTSTHTRL
jgi:hypothetical protein